MIQISPCDACFFFFHTQPVFVSVTTALLETIDYFVVYILIFVLLWLFLPTKMIAPQNTDDFKTKRLYIFSLCVVDEMMKSSYTVIYVCIIDEEAPRLQI